MTATVSPLVGKQARSVELATARTNIWEGSVRSSKTVCSLLAWLMFIRTGPGGNLVMVGKTERTLRRNVIDPLVEMLGPKRCKVNWGDGQATILGRRVYLAGANNEAAVSKIQGLTLAGFYGDELSTWPESFWSMLLTRLSVEGAQGFGTSNPDNPNHWLMRGYLKRARTWLRHDGTVQRSDSPNMLDLARFSFRLDDNPSLPAGYVAELAKTFTGLFRARYIAGMWVLAEGAIYDMWDQDRHLVTKLPRTNGRLLMRRWHLAIDYGTANPFTAVLLGVGPDLDGTDRIWVSAEWRWDSRPEGRQMTDAEYSQALRRWVDETLPERLGERIELDRIDVDPSAASFIAQLWRDSWLGVHQADNRVEDGIRSVSSLLGPADRLRVHTSCQGTDGRTMLVDELTGYVWDEDHAKRTGEERPLKVDDHGPDGLRYGVMGLRREWRHWLTVDPVLSDAA